MDANDTVRDRINLIFEEARRLAVAASSTLVVTAIILALVGIAVDQSPSSPGLNLVFGVVSLAVGYFVVRALLRDGGLVPGEVNGRFGTYFGLALLSGIGLLAGLVILVIPGLVLAVRWSAIYGYGMVDGEGVGDAMSKSWDATGPHFAPIAVSFLVPFGIYAVSMIAVAWAASALGEVNLPLSILGNVGMAIGGNIFTTMGIAIYSLTAGRAQTLAAVFE